MSTTAPKKFTTAGWKSRKVHEITLPSGAQVKVQIPNMALLAKTGRISNDLILMAAEIQSQAIANETPTIEQLQENHEFTKTIVALTVVEPSLTEDQVDDVVPVPDQDLIVALALRATDMDAVYHQLGGLETVASFRDVRGI